VQIVAEEENLIMHIACAMILFRQILTVIHPTDQHQKNIKTVILKHAYIQNHPRTGRATARKTIVEKVDGPQPFPKIPISHVQKEQYTDPKLTPIVLTLRLVEINGLFFRANTSQQKSIQLLDVTQHQI